MKHDVNHYSLSEWTDFARGVTTTPENERMQKHLDVCQYCMGIVKAFGSVTEFAKRESAYTPSEEIVRVARSYFAPMKMAISGAKPFMFGRLTFDSSRTALAEGFRTMQEAPRQLLYISGNTVVDLRIEADPASKRMVLGGQVLSSQQSVKNLPVIQVSLISGFETLATTATNQYGEFHIALSAAKHLQLIFELSSGTLAVQVPEA